MRRVIGYSLLFMLWIVYVIAQVFVMAFEAIESLAEHLTRDDR